MRKLHHGIVRMGKFMPDYPGEFYGDIMKLDKKRISVAIMPEKKAKSTEQRGYYWAVIIKILSDHTGYTKEEMHEAIKHKFLIDETLNPPKVGSTEDLSTAETEELYTAIREWSAIDLGLYIPLPNEVDYE